MTIDQVQRERLGKAAIALVRGDGPRSQVEIIADVTAALVKAYEDGLKAGGEDTRRTAYTGAKLLLQGHGQAVERMLRDLEREITR